jgi:hypothetical protein
MGLKVFSSFVLGLYNSFYVFNLSALIAVLILNDLLKRRFFRSDIFVVSLILSYWFFSFLAVIGFFDLWLGINVTKVLKGINFVLACVYLVMGLLNLKDWKLYKTHQDSNSFKVWPFFREEPKQDLKSSKRFLGLMSGLILGFGLAFLGTLWPQDYYLFILSNELFAGNMLGLTLIALMAYCLGITSIVLLGLLFWQKFKSTENIKTISFIKIISSAFLISVSLSLIYVIVRV